MRYGQSTLWTAAHGELPGRTVLAGRGIGTIASPSGAAHVASAAKIRRCVFIPVNTTLSAATTRHAEALATEVARTPGRYDVIQSAHDKGV